MDEEQTSEEPELGDGVIGCVGSLKTFLAVDTNSNISGLGSPINTRRLGRPRTPYLDHANVIGAIANSQSHDVYSILDKFDDLSFLFGRHTAADNGFT